MRVAPEVMNMVRRKDDNGGTAVVERGNPEDIAARVAAADAAARRAAVVADIEEFRSVVQRIADGSEPDGKALAAIGDLTRRLRLPVGAVSQAVKAVQDDRRHQAEVARIKGRLVEVKAREQELVAELKAAQARLLALQEELAEYRGLHASYPYVVQAANGNRGEHPLLFAPVEHVAEQLTAADSGMATATLAAMVPQAMAAEGHSTATWGG